MFTKLLLALAAFLAFSALSGCAMAPVIPPFLAPLLGRGLMNQFVGLQFLTGRYPIQSHTWSVMVV